MFGCVVTFAFAISISPEHVVPSEEIAKAANSPSPQPTAEPTPDASPTPAATEAPTDFFNLSPGDKLVTTNSKKMSCSPTADDLQAVVKAWAANDETGIEEAESNAIFLFKDTNLLIIDEDYGKQFMKVRVLDGEQAGAACWLSGNDYVRKL